MSQSDETRTAEDSIREIEDREKLQEQIRKDDLLNDIAGALDMLAPIKANIDDMVLKGIMRASREWCPFTGLFDPVAARINVAAAETSAARSIAVQLPPPPLAYDPAIGIYTAEMTEASPYVAALRTLVAEIDAAARAIKAALLTEV